MAILAVVIAIMKNTVKMPKKISFCFSVVVTIACNAFNKNVTYLLASYGPIIHAELFQGNRKCIDHTAANCDDHRTV